jgi:hypothetical protein
MAKIFLENLEDGGELRPSCVTISVAERSEISGEEPGIIQESLEKQPKPEEVIVAKQKLFREVTLVSLEAFREYLALLWKRYQATGTLWVNRLVHYAVNSAVCKNCIFCSAGIFAKASSIGAKTVKGPALFNVSTRALL